MFTVIPSSYLYLERLENAPLDQQKSGALLLCVQIRISLKGMLWHRMQPYRRGSGAGAGTMDFITAYFVWMHKIGGIFLS